jgi:hypothetical protein
VILRGSCATAESIFVCEGVESSTAFRLSPSTYSTYQLISLLLEIRQQKRAFVEQDAANHRQSIFRTYRHIFQSSACPEDGSIDAQSSGSKSHILIKHAHHREFSRPYLQHLLSTPAPLLLVHKVKRIRRAKKLPKIGVPIGHVPINEYDIELTLSVPLTSLDLRDHNFLLQN